MMGDEDHAEIAVLRQRCAELDRRCEEIEERLTERLRELEKNLSHRISAIAVKLEAIADRDKQVRGGLFVLVALGGMLAWGTDLIGKVARLWSH